MTVTMPHTWRASSWTDALDIVVACEAVKIVINEVDPDGPDAVEFYNASSQAVDMTGWRFLAYQFGSPAYTYTFPTFTLQSGTYVVLHENVGTDTATDLYTGSNSFPWPTVGSSGAAALTNGGGTGVDFVRWGSSTVAPPSGTIWTGTNPAGPPSGQTLGRDQASTDTDDGSDWTPQDPTPGMQNLTYGSETSFIYLPLILRNY